MNWSATAPSMMRWSKPMAMVHHRADGDGVIAFLVGEDDRLLDDGADVEDGDLWLIDDRQSEAGAEDSGIGDGEGAALDLVGLQLLGAGALAQVVEGALQADEAQFVGVLDDRHEQSPVEGDGDADIDVALVVDVVAFDRGVHDGPGAQSLGDGADEEGRVGELESGAAAGSGSCSSRAGGRCGSCQRQRRCGRGRWCAREAIMCSAIFLRMTDMGSMRPGRPANLLAERRGSG